MDLLKYGLSPDRLPENPRGMPARITAVHKERYEMVCEHGEIHGRLKTSEYYEDRQPFPTTGDFVLIQYIENGDSQIIETLPRKTFFARLDPSSAGHGEQAVAANFDTVFIMQSLNQDFNARRLERYLTLAWRSGAEPVMILTKSDLVDSPDDFLPTVQAAAPGVPIYAVSAQSGQGLEALATVLKPRSTVVFLGSSGVGKSSLVNAIAGEEIMTVQGIREDDSKGRHTTTHRQLVLLKNGVMIIDTPGMRELGMWDVGEGLSETFSDVEQFIGQCKFSDCRHQTEPGCAIREALSTGALDAARWQSYCKLKSEAKNSEGKSQKMIEKQQWQKEIAKLRKQRKHR